MNSSYRNLEHFHPYTDFTSAAESVLQIISSRIPFNLWMVTKTQQDNWIVLASCDNGYQVKAGDVFSWSDSFCYRMTHGLGPYIAPNSDKISSYACAPIGQQIPIKAYVGVPLIRNDGSLFGTLCGIDPNPYPNSLYEEFEFILTQARLLSTLISDEIKQKISAEKLNFEKRLSQLDELTGVYNRRGWDKFLDIEEHRRNRYNTDASIVMIDLDNLKQINDEQGHKEGDKLIQRTANSLRDVIRSFDVLARMGGDEFAILLVETGNEYTNHLVSRIREVLNENEIQASIGWACSSDKRSLDDIIGIADRRMYEEKHNKKTERH